METTVQAVYEGGVLRSLQPVPFQDRQEVTVTVRVSHEGNIRRDHPLLVSADEWANAATDEISLEEVRRALSRISGSLSKAIIRER
ncbi:MAG TPA: antitoxin family protein [Bryobacteraceae bacterium]|nr:antitoxin family protein [Bryobacteraceae bacterium]